MMMRRARAWTGAAAVIAAVAGATACGDGGGEQGGVSRTESAFRSLTWYLQCPSDPIPHGGSTRSDVVIDSLDAQPHRFSREAFVTTPVTLRGRICAPPPIPRDIVFVIDISGSMLTNDKQDPTTKRCGRLDALEAVIAKLPAGLTQYAVATFDDAARQYSDKLYDSKDAMVAQLTGGQPEKFADIVCNGDGGTMYAPGLTAAETILTTGRADAAKQIVFLSDGAPSDGTAAATKAAALRTTGVPVGGSNIPVLLATIMLGRGDARVLRDQIASQIPKADDPSVTVPLHANASNAGELPDIVDRMAGNKPSSGIVSHGADAAPRSHTIDFVPSLDGRDFEIRGLELAIDPRQRSYVVNFGYTFVQGSAYSITGQLQWTD